MKIAALIPSRLESSRLPRKALLDICGLPMIVHVLKRTQLASNLNDVFVVTDNAEIKQAVEQHGGRVIMTRSDHETGTDRIAEAAENLDHDILVNVQGDEALVNPHYVDRVVEALANSPAHQVAMLVNPYFKLNSPSDIKVVLNQKNEVMYLSRQDIPSNARTPNAPMLKAYHIIPFRREFLLQYAAWPKGDLERIEFNEYLRILEQGVPILGVKVESQAVSIDTAQDLEFVRTQMPTDPFFERM